MRKPWSRRKVDRMQNVVIVLLICSALVLVGKTGMFDSVAGDGAGPAGAGAAAGFQDTALSRGTPVGLLIQTQAGRYGVQYDQTAAGRLYHDGLDDLLAQALSAAERARTSSEEEWRQAVSQSEHWVFYDFLYNVSFSDQDEKGEGTARRFLVTAKGGRADALYYYNQETEEYTSCRIKDAGAELPALLQGLPDNGGQFAFEVPELASLPGTSMVLPQTPSCPVYTASNPLEGMETAVQQELLEILDVNIRAASIYESADGTVIQEGSDTLRFQKNGTMIFHGTDNGEARYQALSAREKDLQIKAEEIFKSVTDGRCGEGTMLCKTIAAGTDGSVELLFCWLLNGVEVHLWEEGWTARFVFQGSSLTDFSIHLRRYEKDDGTSVILPQRQAAAAAEAMGQSGKELRLCYQDSGNGLVSANWTVRETG